MCARALWLVLWQLLSSGISEDVVTAMRQIVTYILRAPSGEGELDAKAEVTLEQQKLMDLCLYQLILGYTLREAEAKGEASDMDNCVIKDGQKTKRQAQESVQRSRRASGETTRPRAADCARRAP